MIHQDLAQYYLDQGLTSQQFWIGPEHPQLEELALSILEKAELKKVLEIGYQAGGFAVPVIYSLKNSPGFLYTGIDNLSYINSVNGEMIASFLKGKGVAGDKFQFLVGDADDLLSAFKVRFDIILLDHLKILYPKELETIFKRRLLAEDGAILVHDVLDKASEPWGKCVKLCRKFGYSWEIRSDIPSGLAIVRKGKRRQGLIERIRLFK